MKAMHFCNKCGKLLHVKEQEGILIGKCSCGFLKKIDSVMEISEKGKQSKIAKGVFENIESKGGFPHTCQKCGHTQSDVHDLGAPYSDESNVYLFKCKKCGYVERQADGSGNG